MSDAKFRIARTTNHRLCQGRLRPAVKDRLYEDKGDEYNNVVV